MYICMSGVPAIVDHCNCLLKLIYLHFLLLHLVLQWVYFVEGPTLQQGACVQREREMLITCLVCYHPWL